MKSVKYLNAVLTVIAFCLVMITLAVTGLLPTASAKQVDKKMVAIPVNADGTINVNIVSSSPTLNVRLQSCDGSAFFQAEPIRVKLDN